MLDFSVTADITIDDLEQDVIDCERLIGRLRARQLGSLRELDRRQVRHMDGSRTMADWTSARLDITAATAGSLLRAARTLVDRPDLESQLADGAMSFDRAAATARLAATGASEDDIAASFGFDLNGVARLVARRRRLSRSSEEQAFRDRYLHIQPSLDLSKFKGWFELPGFEGTIVEKALSQRADEFPDTGSTDRPGRSTRLADALVSVAQDSLDPATGTGSSSADPLVSVFVEERTATETGGEAGAEIAAGPEVGPSTLERILCGGRVQLIWTLEGRPVRSSAATRAIPPAIRRFVLQRDGGCVVAGCTSRYRLQPHHIIPVSQGGSHDPENLATMCWYHHHVAIHGAGYTIDATSPPRRRRLLPPARGP